MDIFRKKYNKTDSIENEKLVSYNSYHKGHELLSNIWRDDMQKKS